MEKLYRAEPELAVGVSHDKQSNVPLRIIPQVSAFRN